MNSSLTGDQAPGCEHKSPRSTPNILVADDDRVLLELLDKVLRKLGFQVALAKNGKEAIDIVQKATPDVVLLDINMPGMDGIQALKEIKEQDADIEVVIITGYASLDSAVEALKYGVSDYLRKPFDRLDQVVDAIRRAWERRKPRLIKRNAKSSSERRIYELKLLYSISRLIASCNNPSEMIVRLLESLRKIIDYDLAMALLVKEHQIMETALPVVNPCTPDFVDQSKSSLTDAFKSATNSDSALPAEFDLIIGQGNIKSPSTDAASVSKEMEASEETRVAERLNSFLNVPLVTDGKIVGMINVSGHRNDLFTPDDISLIYALVSQVPSAIQRLEKMQAVERNRTDRLAEMVSDGVIMIDEKLNVLLMNQVAQEILGAKKADIQMIQTVLGVDLTSLKMESEKEVSDLVVKDRDIRSESYEITASAVRRPDGPLLGFIISIRKSQDV